MNTLSNSLSNLSVVGATGSTTCTTSASTVIGPTGSPAGSLVPVPVDPKKEITLLNELVPFFSEEVQKEVERLVAHKLALGYTLSHFLLPPPGILSLRVDPGLQSAVRLAGVKNSAATLWMAAKYHAVDGFPEGCGWTKLELFGEKGALVVPFQDSTGHGYKLHYPHMIRGSYSNDKLLAWGNDISAGSIYTDLVSVTEKDLRPATEQDCRAWVVKHHVLASPTPTTFCRSS